MFKDVPAAGYKLISGKRAPKQGEKYWVQYRNGWLDLHGPYPSKGPRWWWRDAKDDWDIVAVKKAL